MNKSKFQINVEKFKNVIKTTEFKYLQNLEKREGFKEARNHKTTKEKIPFFNLGPKRDWRKSLDLKLKKKIEKVFQKEMNELGYL